MGGIVMLVQYLIMNGIAILAVILVVSITMVVIIKAIKIFKEEGSRKGRKLASDEARMIQEIYQGLSRMEKRIEALETIILDRGTKGRHHESI